jgi:hypothetical protein
VVDLTSVKYAGVLQRRFCLQRDNEEHKHSAYYVVLMKSVMRDVVGVKLKQKHSTALSHSSRTLNIVSFP